LPDKSNKRDIAIFQTNNVGGIRKYDKVSYCLFCGTAQSQVARHWFAKHKAEHEVIEILQCCKADKGKNIMKLRNFGNYVHNCEVLKTGKGTTIPTYRPKHSQNVENYVGCNNCYAYLHKGEFYRHRCKFGERSRGHVAKKAALLLPTPNGLMPDVWKLINGMVDGEIKLLARNDSVICKLAAKLL
jgi:hypothetical protein